MKFLRIVGLLFISFILILLVLSYLAKDSYIERRNRLSPHASDEMASVTAKEPIIPKVNQWSYSKYVDEMTSGETRSATIDARDLIELDFPYAGHNQPDLSVRKDAKAKFSVMYTITKGQILCHDCYVQVRFDDRQPINFSGGGSVSHRTEVLFLTPAKKFVDLMKKSKVVKIEVMIYKKGRIVSTFDVAEFDESMPQVKEM